MQHTLIAVFDNHNDAMSAKNELLSSGFSSGDVRLSHGDESAPGGLMSSTGGAAPSTSTTTTTATTADHEPSIGESIKNFFSDIFGSDNDRYSTQYSDAVNRGNHVLRVNTDSEAEVERAADIVERFGPIDIDEQSEQWGMTEGSGAMLGGSRSMSGGQSASLQFDADRLPLNQQSLNDPVPMGTTYQEPMSSRDELATGNYGVGTGGSLQRDVGGMGGIGGKDQLTAAQRGAVRVFSRSIDTSAGQAGAGATRSGLSNDDDYYRKHFASTYGSTGGVYDDYAPAYGFGSDMARDQRYSGRKWDDVENDLRTDWTSRYGSNTGSTWEKMKDAIRHGWNRLTSDDDDSYYRNHYNTTYSSIAGAGDYDKYKPAYSYGSEMSQSQMYRNRPWDEVEPNLRSDWESRNTGTGSTWEDMKAAVRHGWNKMTK